MYLLTQGLSVRDPKKQRVANGSGMNVNIACLQFISIGMKLRGLVCVILDDASRKVLAGGEFRAINTENSFIVVMPSRYDYCNFIAL